MKLTNVGIRINGNRELNKMLSKQKIKKPEIATIKYIQSGEIAIGSKNELLVSSPLGTCVAVMAYDAKTKICGMAHIMLPGKSHIENALHKNRYAADAIDDLLSKLHQAGVPSENIDICLAGGANVLKKENDTISTELAASVFKIIGEKKLKIRATSLGGYERRIASLNPETGAAYYTIGESPELVLWKFGIKKG